MVMASVSTEFACAALGGRAMIVLMVSSECAFENLSKLSLF